MDKQIQKINSQPDYHKIFLDIIRLRYPEKVKYCQPILALKNLSALDIIKLNTIIFSDATKENILLNQQHRSYDRSAILKILDYQKRNNLNNMQLANKFKLSRNSVSKWKKLFQ